jgi:hypothetical protein
MRPCLEAWIPNHAFEPVFLAECSPTNTAGAAHCGARDYFRRLKENLLLRPNPKNAKIQDPCIVRRWLILALCMEPNAHLARWQSNFDDLLGRDVDGLQHSAVTKYL